MAPKRVCTRNPATNGIVRDCATEVSTPRVSTSHAASTVVITSQAMPEATDHPM